jgi:hypothetical protein
MAGSLEKLKGNREGGCVFELPHSFWEFQFARTPLK